MIFEISSDRAAEIPSAIPPEILPELPAGIAPRIIAESFAGKYVEGFFEKFRKELPQKCLR